MVAVLVYVRNHSCNTDKHADHIGILYVCYNVLKHFLVQYKVGSVPKFVHGALRNLRYVCTGQLSRPIASVRNSTRIKLTECKKKNQKNFRRDWVQCIPIRCTFRSSVKNCHIIQHIKCEKQEKIVGRPYVVSFFFLQALIKMIRFPIP